jgi:hypothetical protein
VRALTCNPSQTNELHDLVRAPSQHKAVARSASERAEDHDNTRGCCSRRHRRRWRAFRGAGCLFFMRAHLKPCRFYCCINLVRRANSWQPVAELYVLLLLHVIIVVWVVCSCQALHTHAHLAVNTLECMSSHTVSRAGTVRAAKLPRKKSCCIPTHSKQTCHPA